MLRQCLLKTFAREAALAWDSATLRVKDLMDQATLVERVALKRVLRVEAENAVALASAREDAKGFVRKITILEDEHAVERQAQEVSERECQAQFKELTLLQTWGSELCHVIIGPP
jgi:uncharacterized protein YaiL (DUF2058 family)